MKSVIDLAAFRERRAQAEGCHKLWPPDDLRDDQIQIQLQPDGSYRATITGIYADDSTIAIEVMVDAIRHLAAESPLFAIRQMASAIKQLSGDAKHRTG